MSFNIVPSEIKNAISPKVATVLAWVMGLITAVLISPIIFLAVKGIIGAALAILVGFISLKLAPWVGMVVSNGVLKLIKYEARINPVETKMAIFVEDKKNIEEFEQECKNFTSEVSSFKVQVDKFIKQYPDEAQTFLEQYNDMVALRDVRYQTLAQAKVDLENFWSEIQKCQAIWDMTKAGDRMDKAAGRISEKDAIRRIKERESSIAIEAGMARTRAALQHARQMETPKQVIHQEQTTFLVRGVDRVYAPIPVDTRKGSEA